MALRQHHKLKQSFRLSPLQMQMIRLLELNSIELEDRIKKEMEENPALDEKFDKDESDEAMKNRDDEYEEPLSEEELIKGDYSSEEDMPDYRYSAPSSSSYAEPSIDFALTGDSSLHESLLDQIKLRKIDEYEQSIAEYIIEIGRAHV